MTQIAEETATPTTAAVGEATPAGSTPAGKLMGRLAAHRWTARVLIASMAMLVALIGGQGAAQASQNNYSFDAYCNSNQGITAWAPDLTHEGAEWTVVWAPTLYRYNGASWVKYLYGAS